MALSFKPTKKERDLDTDGHGIDTGLKTIGHCLRINDFLGGKKMRTQELWKVMMVLVMVVVCANSGAKAEILQVPAYGTPTVTSSTVLEEGQLYVIEAQGTYIYWGTGQKPADAEWYERAYEPGSWLEFSPDPCDNPSILDLLVDGEGYDWLGTTDGVNFAPHVYSPSHVYRLYYVGEGTTIDLKIEDGSGANVLDNSGSLEVEISVAEAAVVEMEWVTVGDAGNAADDTGYGAVDYVYRIGKYEVTNSQYCEFLNAVADVCDLYGLYNRRD